MIYGKALRTGLAVAALAGLGTPGAARAADKANISGLGDVDFGSIGAFADQAATQGICVFAQNATGRYSVVASGNASSGAFQLSSGAGALPFDALWSASPGQPGGTTLLPGVAASGFTSSATQKTCNSGPATSAALTLVIRSTALGAATAGTYAGTIQLTIIPE